MQTCRSVIFQLHTHTSTHTKHTHTNTRTQINTRTHIHKHTHTLALARNSGNKVKFQVRYAGRGMPFRCKIFRTSSACEIEVLFPGLNRTQATGVKGGPSSLQTQAGIEPTSHHCERRAFFSHERIEPTTQHCERRALSPGWDRNQTGRSSGVLPWYERSLT